MPIPTIQCLPSLMCLLYTFGADICHTRVRAAPPETKKTDFLSALYLYTKHQTHKQPPATNNSLDTGKTP